MLYVCLDPCWLLVYPFCLLQVFKVASVFKVKQDTLYLREMYSDTAVFPNKSSGRFSPQQLHCGHTYAVCGDETGAERALDLPSVSLSYASGSSFASAPSGFSSTKPISLSL